ncbi:MraY family glycosyltransferase [Catalinimonas niigatensis]|uniref:MraY family glycosyltransferase n=1 Tax=Catalinimonas niigatensis TaxID=1397264 RepID=UPI0026651539|nr:MraY family glycosyltransferase [Catalinimonas niigatensis]WPP52923.1 MraY family glycosyltransferase [Catalinimonas niigatensis]
MGLTIWGSLRPSNGLQYVIAALTLIFFTGLKEDVLIIDPVKKLLAQILAALLLIIGADLRIESFYGILGIEELPYLISLLFSLFVYVVVTNAYNLIDGIDGLASGLGALAALCFGVWFLLTGFTDYAVLAFCLCGALIGFVRYNLSRSEKIFPGDTGSLIIGITIAALAMQFIQTNAYVRGEYHLENAPFIALAVLGVPLFDTLRVFTIRLMIGQSPFFLDKRHIHHILIRRNPSHLRASFMLIFFSVVYIAMSSQIYQLSNIYLAVLYLLLSFTLYIALCSMLEKARPRTFKHFFMRYIPFVYFIFWSRYLRR